MLHLIMTLLVHGVYMESAKCPESCSCAQTLVSESSITESIKSFDERSFASASFQFEPMAYQSELSAVDKNSFNDTNSLSSRKKCRENKTSNFKNIFRHNSETINFKSSRKKRTLKIQEDSKPNVNQTFHNQNESKAPVTEKAFRKKDVFTYQISCSGLRDLKPIWIQYLPSPTTRLNIQKTNFQSFKDFLQILKESPIKLNRLSVLSVSDSIINQTSGDKYIIERISPTIEITEKKNHSEFLPFASIQNPKLRSESSMEYSAHGKCKNLQILILTNNTIVHLLQDSFYPFVDLKLLNLSNNQIEFIDNKAFSSLTNLITLDLHSNRLNSLNEIIFKNLTKLVFLDVSQNLISYLEPSAFQYLVSLNVLILASNPLTEKQEGIVLLNTGKRLQLVDISKTGLKQIPGTLERSVRVLNLKGNLLLSIRCGDLDSYSLLAYLNLEGNKISYIEDDALGRLEFLKNLQIGDNNLFQAPKILPNNLEILNLSYNNIQDITKLDFLNLSLLKELYLNYNQITSIEENAFNNLVHLKVLDLSRNPIVVLPSIYGQIKLTLLDLSYFTSIPGSYSAKYKQFPLQSPQTVKSLNLESSPVLTKIFLQDTKTLKLFTSLEELNLRFTNLTTIRKDIFNLLPKLKVLKVEGNPWHCGKEILALSVWLRSHEYYGNSPNENEINTAHCLTPSELYKTNLISLEEKNYMKSTNKTDNRSISTIVDGSLVGLKNEPKKTSSELLPSVSDMNIRKYNSSSRSEGTTDIHCCTDSTEKPKSLAENSTAVDKLQSTRKSSLNDLKAASSYAEQKFISWSNSLNDSENEKKNLTLRQVLYPNVKKAEAVTSKNIHNFEEEYKFHINFFIFSFVGLVVMTALSFTSFYFTRTRKQPNYQRQNQDIEVCSISSTGLELW